MPEYVVDCMHLPYGDGLTLVLPVSINGHVHERIIRCRDCDLSDEARLLDGTPALCCNRFRTFPHVTSPDGYCDKAVPRSDDGNRT